MDSGKMYRSIQAFNVMIPLFIKQHNKGQNYKILLSTQNNATKGHFVLKLKRTKGHWHQDD